MIRYKKPKYRIQTDSLEIKSINITELDNFTYDYVLVIKDLNQDLQLVINSWKPGVNNINTTNNFSVISYSLDPNMGGDDLNLYLKENPIKTYLKFGLHYDGLFRVAYW
jgi:NTE family protein